MSDNRTDDFVPTPLGQILEEEKQQRMAARWRGASVNGGQRPDPGAKLLADMDASRDRQIAQLSQTAHGRKVLAGHGITVTANKTPVPHPNPNGNRRAQSSGPNANTQNQPTAQQSNQRSGTSGAAPSPNPNPNNMPQRQWVGPTGNGVRGTDAHGSGSFGAGRKRNWGRGSHEGVDYIATPGQDVVAVTDGVVTHIGQVYTNNPKYKSIHIRTPDGYHIKQFYIDAKPGLLGQTVQAGDVIGTAQEQGKDKGKQGITEHIHVEIRHNGKLLHPDHFITNP